MLENDSRAFLICGWTALRPYRGEDKGKDWVEKALGWTVELVEHPRNTAPEKVLEVWATE
jgi:hypothetical protein